MSHPSVRSRSFACFALLLALGTSLGCRRRSTSQGRDGLHLVSVSWGRHVALVDGEGYVVQRDLVVGEDVGNLWEGVEVGRPTGILAFVLTVEPVRGTSAFLTLRDRLDDQRGVLPAQPLNAAEPFVHVPRDAALRLTFDRPLDPASIDASSVSLWNLDAPGVALPVCRIVDPLEPNVLIVDPVVSTLRALETGERVSPMGFPEGRTERVASVRLRLSTDGDHSVRGAHGERLRAEREPVDPSEPDAITRFFGTRRREDPQRGFLFDLQAPELLLESSITLDQVSGDTVSFAFDDPRCATTVRVGDMIEQGKRRGEIVSSGGNGGSMMAKVRRWDRTGEPFSTLESARYVSTWDPRSHAPECLLRFAPERTSVGRPVAPTSAVAVRFSEPMDPASVTPFDALYLALSTVGHVDHDEYVIGSVLPSADLTRFAFVPAGSGQAHRRGIAETMHAHVVPAPSRPNQLRDLAGTPATFASVQAPYTLDAAAADVGTHGLVLRFDGVDETRDGRADHHGHFGWETVQDPSGERIPTGRFRARPVTRFSRWVDASKPVVGYMHPWPPLGSSTGVREPLSPFGCRVQSVWRYIDLDLSYPFLSHQDLDVEGLAFSPVEGRAYQDAFRRVRLSLSHAMHLPDEYVDWLGGQRSVYPLSGLSMTSFASNALTDARHPAAAVMFDGPFVIDPTSVTSAPGSGTVLLDWPAFRDAHGERVTYTWRDTSLEGLAASAGEGCDPRVLETVRGSRHTYVSPGQVPSIGLPLLMDFQVWPAEPGNETLGLNGFQASITMTNSARPTFRVHSTGGIDANGVRHEVDPEHDVPMGGGEPGPFTHSTGQPSRPDDNVVYWGRVDFVVKVSRHVTRWFDTGSENPVFEVALVEPSAARQPDGTSLIVEYRGADDVQPANALASTRADCFDLYGEVVSTVFDPSCVGERGTIVRRTDWTRDVTTLQGKRWIQMRVTGIANITTSQVPAVDSIALGWRVDS